MLLLMASARRTCAHMVSGMCRERRRQQDHQHSQGQGSLAPHVCHGREAWEGRGVLLEEGWDPEDGEARQAAAPARPPASWLVRGKPRVYGPDWGLDVHVAHQWALFDRTGVFGVGKPVYFGKPEAAYLFSVCNTRWAPGLAWWSVCSWHRDVPSSEHC